MLLLLLPPLSLSLSLFLFLRGVSVGSLRESTHAAAEETKKKGKHDGDGLPVAKKRKFFAAAGVAAKSE